MSMSEIYSELNEVVLEIPSENCSMETSPTIIKIFHEDYQKFLQKNIFAKQKLLQKIAKRDQFKQSLSGRFVALSTRQQTKLLVTITSIASFSGVVTIIYGEPLLGSIITGSSLLTGFGLSCVIPSIFYSATNKKAHLKAQIKKHQKKIQMLEAVFHVVEAGSEFLQLFENFKAAPKEKDIQNLFFSLQNIKTTYNAHARNHPLLEYKFTDLNVLVLNPVGTLMLMEKVALLINGSVKTEWNALKEAIFEGDETPFLRPLQPWTSLGLESPILDSYIEFKDFTDELKDIQLDEHMIEIFKKALSR